MYVTKKERVILIFIITEMAIGESLKGPEIILILDLHSLSFTF